jgi:putative sigma-54 modulation protein
MRLQIHSRGVELTPSLREYVERRLRFALGRFADRIAEVTASVEDLNGPRGGLDQRCRLSVALVRSGRLLVEATATDAAGAASLASERMARRVRAELERRRSIRRKASRYVSEGLQRGMTP